MHIVVVTDNVPTTRMGGGALTAWSVIEALRAAKHQVTAVLLMPAEPFPGPREQKEWLNELAATGTEVVEVPMPLRQYSPHPIGRRLTTLRRLLAPRLEDFYPTAKVARPVAEALERVRPDAVFCYHFVATAATHGLRGAPRLAVFGDIDHFIWYYRWRYTPPRLTLGYLALLLQVLVTRPQLPRILAGVLADCEASGSFAAQHAEWFRRRGVPECRYFQTPVSDMAGPQWTSRRSRTPHERLRILMVGHMQGIATLSGLDLFARETLPELERLLGPEGFEVRIAGRFAPPAWLARGLARPSVRLLGFVDEIAEEFNACDVMLVPTPLPISLRVRILTGFSFGCAVVAHESNALGTPELAHGTNVLLGRDGRDLATQIVAAWRDPALRARIGAEGRATYERYFTPEAAGARIAENLVQLAAARRSGG